MTIQSFTGGAGCGKTHQLMEALEHYLDASPLQEGQRVLALTFMHGSRRRLDERLGHIFRREVATIDSFAWRLVRRWVSLASAIGFPNIEHGDHDKICEAAGVLLQRKEVCGWVAATFPVVIVDEAQDLSETRLNIVKGLSDRLEVLLAADEFQCLDQSLRDNPTCKWLKEECPNNHELNLPRRTQITELLNAASAIRNGESPQSGNKFRIGVTPTAPLAGSYINSNLSWYGGGKKVAIITPTLGAFAENSLSWSASKTNGRGLGPHQVNWERPESRLADDYIERLDLHSTVEATSLTELVHQAGEAHITNRMVDWLNTQRRALGRTEFSKDEVIKVTRQAFSQERRLGGRRSRNWSGMTVHGAKNREFDNVIVLWPAALGGDDEQKRRLLYNAVTRAKLRCLVLVQVAEHLKQAPFT